MAAALAVACLAQQGMELFPDYGLDSLPRFRLTGQAQECRDYILCRANVIGGYELEECSNTYCDCQTDDNAVEAVSTLFSFCLHSSCTTNYKCLLEGSDDFEGFFY